MVEQGTEEWLQQRVGKATASRLADALARTKTGWGAGRDAYMAELVTERLTGNPYPQFISGDMKRGTELEPMARAAYEIRRKAMVFQTGLVDHPKIPMFGASPDGLVDDDGLLEIKCPASHTHIKYLRTRVIPGEYQKQMIGQMACTGRKWCDWMSFDDRLPEPLQLVIVRFEPDPKLIAEVEKEVVEFLAEVDALHKELANMQGD